MNNAANTEVDTTFLCEDCRGFGLYASGRTCSACSGHGARLCMGCHARPATQVEDGWYSCGDCAALDDACGFCLSGQPTCFVGETVCCEKCRDGLRESGRDSDTLRCGAPDFEEVA